jgi:hypothetical protein
MGILFMPSLKERKFFEIRNVNLDDATEFVKSFTAQVKVSHKTKDNGDNASDFVVYNGMIDLDEYDGGVDFLEENDMYGLADILQIADTVGTRGARAVFVQDDGTFAVGTTVVYNRNWATTNFDDKSVLDKVREDFPLTIDATPVDPNDQTSWYGPPAAY